MTKFINEENLTEAAKIIKQYVDENSGGDIDLSKIVNSTSPNARYAISNTDDGIVADYDSSRSEDGVIVGGGTHNSFEITDTGVKLRSSQTRVVAGGVTGYDNSIEISEDGVMVNGNAIATQRKFASVTASEWTQSAEYSDYPYAVDLLQDKGISESDFAEVVFDVAEATSGDYAPVAKTGDFGVRIYAKVNTEITIPQIIITGGA